MRTALDMLDPDDNIRPIHSAASATFAVVTSTENGINQAEMNLMQVGGSVTPNISPNAYQGMTYGYSYTSENKRCDVCKAKGMRRTWIHDVERDKMIKGSLVKCEPCDGKGWMLVMTTHYPSQPYTYMINNDVPYTPPPYTPPFYGSTTTAPLGG